MAATLQYDQPKAGLVYAPDSPLAAIERECIKVAGSEANVLLNGDTGTGKEVFARLVHAHSARAAGPFVPVNCAAIPDSLVESELFGYVKGAFTGAQTSRKGRLAHAHGGTLFLAEIGELPPATQAKLLRVLQEKQFEPVGSVESQEADFRLVAATNRDLAVDVEQGRFRRDLYYRLLVCPLLLPPLRDRAGDVGPLFLHFWAQRRETRAVEPAALDALALYEWPGNVRELENLVERISVCTSSPVIRVADLLLNIQRKLAPPQPAEQRRALLRVVGQENEAPQHRPPALEFPVDLPNLLRSLEEEYVDAALARANGSRKMAADLLGIHRTTLVEKLRRWGRDQGKG